MSCHIGWRSSWEKPCIARKHNPNLQYLCQVKANTSKSSKEISDTIQRQRDVQPTSLIWNKNAFRIFRISFILHLFGSMDQLHCLWTYLLCFPDGGSHVFEVVWLFVNLVGQRGNVSVATFNLNTRRSLFIPRAPFFNLWLCGQEYKIVFEVKCRRL